LNSLGEMFRVQTVFTRQIRYCSCNFENAVVAARAEPERGDGVLHDLFAVCRKYTVLANQTRTHLGVAINVFIKESTEKTTRNFKVHCIIDEVGQFLEGSPQLILNMQGLADTVCDCPRVRAGWAVSTGERSTGRLSVEAVKTSQVD